MGGLQIATSVTIISSLKGFMGLSLTNYTTSALSAIASGSVLEVAGAFFQWTTEEAINASSWTAIASASTAYLQCTPSGSAGSQILTSSWTTTGPTWREDFQGWYASAASNIRIIGHSAKMSATKQETKELYIYGRNRIFKRTIAIGDWNMVSDMNKSVEHNMGDLWKNIKTLGGYIRDDTDVSYNTIPFDDGSGIELSFWVGGITPHVTHDGVYIRLWRGLGPFDHTTHDSTSYNRGEIFIEYGM